MLRRFTDHKLMHVARPATIANDLFSRLFLFLTGPAPTKFDIRRFESEISALENVDKAEAFSARAALYALQWDVKSAVSWSDRAILVSGESKNFVNAAITMRYLNRPDLGVSYALRAMDLAQLDQEAHNVGVSLLASDGQLTEAVLRTNEFERRLGKMGALKFQTAPFLETLQKIELPESRVQKETRAAMQVLTSERIRHSAVTYERAPEPDGGLMLSVIVSFVGSIEDELRLEAQLAQVLCLDPEWDPCRLSVEFQHDVTEDAGQAA
jgi:hypothetical protein